MPKMGLGELVAFVGVSLVVIVTPGQDTALRSGTRSREAGEAVC
jgi:threonine/homoserine/homoserine lactone efflux protein